MTSYKTKADKGRLSARVRFTSLRLDLESEDPVRTLQELNKTLHALRGVEMARDIDLQDDPLVWRLGYISEELRDDPELMEFMGQAMRVEENARHKRIAIDNKKIIDFDKNRCSSAVSMDNVRPRLMRLCAGHETAGSAVIHIAGKVSDDEKQAIVDMVRQRLPKAQLKTLFTNKEHLGKTVIELVFFGPFEEEEPRH